VFRPAPPFGPQPFQHRPFLPGVALGLVNLAFGLAYGWVCAEKEATEARERRTARLLRHSQARALQNQLDPHVLYNALNGLTELVHEDPLAAEEAIVRLADLYRMLTVHGDATVIRLEQERRLVEAYLAMEQMRLGDRLRVEWQWPAWADQLELPPYFLLPLVENAIKHGMGPAVELLVENTGCPFQGRGKGVGLTNLETRLGLWTELAAGFTLEARGSWTAASVQWLSEVP
jgi:LytS/YehU family sensor histidine kinase